MFGLYNDLKNNEKENEQEPEFGKVIGAEFTSTAVITSDGEFALLFFPVHWRLGSGVKSMNDVCSFTALRVDNRLPVNPYVKNKNTIANTYRDRFQKHFLL